MEVESKVSIVNSGLKLKLQIWWCSCILS